MSNYQAQVPIETSQKSLDFLPLCTPGRKKMVQPMTYYDIVCNREARSNDSQRPCQCVIADNECKVYILVTELSSGYVVLFPLIQPH